MSRLVFSILIFLASFCLTTLIACSTAYIAFSDAGVIGESIREFCYSTFLIFRFPSQHISWLKAALPEIQHQLIVNSMLYAIVITFIAFTFQVIGKKTR